MEGKRRWSYIGQGHHISNCFLRDTDPDRLLLVFQSCRTVSPHTSHNSDRRSSHNSSGSGCTLQGASVVVQTECYVLCCQFLNYLDKGIGTASVYSPCHRLLFCCPLHRCQTHNTTHTSLEMKSTKFTRSFLKKGKELGGWRYLWLCHLGWSKTSSLDNCNSLI